MILRLGGGPYVFIGEQHDAELHFEILARHMPLQIERLWSTPTWTRQTLGGVVVQPSHGPMPLK